MRDRPKSRVTYGHSHAFFRTYIDFTALFTVRFWKKKLQTVANSETNLGVKNFLSWEPGNILFWVLVFPWRYGQIFAPICAVCQSLSDIGETISPEIKLFFPSTRGRINLFDASFVLRLSQPTGSPGSKNFRDVTDRVSWRYGRVRL